MYIHIHSKSADNNCSSGKTQWAWSQQYNIEIEEGKQAHKGMVVMKIKGFDSYSYGWTKDVNKEFVVELSPKDLELICAAAVEKKLLTFTPKATKPNKKK